MPVVRYFLFVGAALLAFLFGIFDPIIRHDVCPLSSLSETLILPCNCVCHTASGS